MARRKSLNDAQWTGLLLPPTEEREIVRHYTLSDEDLAVVASKRGDHNRIGFARLLLMSKNALASSSNRVATDCCNSNSSDVAVSAIAGRTRSVTGLVGLKARSPARNLSL